MEYDNQYFLYHWNIVVSTIHRHVNLKINVFDKVLNFVK